MKIRGLTAKEILDSRGVPTVKVELKTADGLFVASTPSGTSTGKHEAVAVEVKKAIYNVREVISPKLLEKEWSHQQEIDQVLIGLAGENKAKLGANAVLPVSMACCRALAQRHNLPLYSYISRITGPIRTNSAVNLPRPCVLLVEGGRHAENRLNVQEFMVVGEGSSFVGNYKTAVKAHEGLKKVLKEEFGKEGIRAGYEGGFAPPFSKASDAFNLIMEAVKAVGLEDKVKIGIDVAASEFWEQGAYNFEGTARSRDKLLRFYIKLVKKYPILFIEDPFAEDDFEGWRSAGELRDRGVLVVGDDLTVTNPARMAEAHSKGLCNAAIIKPNQIGTVTETIKAAKLAEAFGWKTVVSHRSGDTEDGFIADLAVGVAAEFIKSGGPFKPERRAKYERLLAIEKEVC